MLCVLRPSPCLPLRRFLCKCSAPDMSWYREAFARRMAMAGIKPHHRIALGVSGGPDSMALCVLTAGWKLDGSVAKNKSSGFIDGLLGIVVDHRLRAASTEEAILVRDRVNKMGVKCEIETCTWSGGRPKHGHLQEAAREMRYQIFEDVCIKQHIGILLIAQHADDQAELLILRLSRNSGVLGLAGMAFVSQLFPASLRYGENAAYDGILLVRPILEFTKDDMYKICQGANQEWVEDPTNQSPLYARNRIRSSLRRLSSDLFQLELQRLISACRIGRSYVDSICHKMIKHSVTIMEHGYAVVDLEKLEPSSVDDLCLSRYLAWILQYISQRHRPIRGSISRLLLGYIHSFPCKTSLTAAGCYLSPAPQSKGTKLLVCYSVDSPQSSRTEQLCYKYSLEEEHFMLPSEIHQIVIDAKSYSDQFLLEASGVPILHARSSMAILSEARKLNLISDSTLESISSLQAEEYKKFSSVGEVKPPYDLRYKAQCVSPSSVNIHPGQSCLFMNRFLVTWTHHNKQDHACQFCMVEQETSVGIRHMVDADWLFLAELSKGPGMEYDEDHAETPVCNLTKNVEQRGESSSFIQLSAQRALRVLKLIPVPARKALPVLVSSKGLLLSIPALSLPFSGHSIQAQSSSWRRLQSDFLKSELRKHCCCCFGSSSSFHTELKPSHGGWIADMRKPTVKCNLVNFSYPLSIIVELFSHKRRCKEHGRICLPQIPIKCDWSFDGSNGILASGGREILFRSFRGILVSRNPISSAACDDSYAFIGFGATVLGGVRYRPPLSSCSRSGRPEHGPGITAGFSISGGDRGPVRRRVWPLGRVKEGGDMELKWGSGRLWPAALVALAAVAVVVAADRGLRPEAAGAEVVEAEEVGVSDYVLKVVNFLWRPDESSYQHSMKFGWEIVVGTIIGFLGSAFGSVGGVGGGGIYVPMLTLIIGFDAKSSTAISKCMIMGAAGSTVWYNLKLRHPTLDMPIIDYDLALLFQPMLMLGISIGVTFNVIFADWMVTVLLIILFIGTSTKAFLKGVETWKKETIMKKEAAMLKESNGRDEIEYKALPSGPGGASKKARRQEAPITENVYWKELGLLCFVWITFLILQVLKVPVSLGVSGYEAVSLYRGKRIISSKGEEGINFTVIQLIFYCLIGVLAGVVGGLLGLGGGFILGPVFLELGVPPQVCASITLFLAAVKISTSLVVLDLTFDNVENTLLWRSFSMECNAMSMID
ncbi:PP-loop family [Musa troglodytarum]|uniref:tRNA(Ile)-lysidine synthetase n=1 Tax=Musa troglodytarum TaxID=320322 RepID=A0A9E7GLW2_9LILI|nr:PP-loop family [Musa troglodytarum]